MILELADDPALRASIGAANQSRIKEQYNAQHMCEETASLLLT
jgi:hypothetical protein